MNMTKWADRGHKARIYSCIHCNFFCFFSFPQKCNFSPLMDDVIIALSYIVILILFQYIICSNNKWINALKKPSLGLTAEGHRHLLSRFNLQHPHSLLLHRTFTVLYLPICPAFISAPVQTAGGTHVLSFPIVERDRTETELLARVPSCKLTALQAVTLWASVSVLNQHRKRKNQQMHQKSKRMKLSQRNPAISVTFL